jgi:hypothetical protein
VLGPWRPFSLQITAADEENSVRNRKRTPEREWLQGKKREKQMPLASLRSPPPPPVTQFHER